MASIYDQLTFNTLRNNQDTNLLPSNRNTNRYSGLSSGQQWFPDEQVDETVTTEYPGGNPVYPGNPGLYQDRIMRMASGVEPGYGMPAANTNQYIQRKEEPDNQFNLSNIFSPVKSGIEWLGDKFKRPDAKQAAYESIMGGRSIQPWQTGQYKGNQYGLYNSPSGLKVSSDVLGWGEGYEKNFDSAFGSKSLEEMEQKKLDWAMNRLQNKKAISQRLRDVLTARGLIGGNIGDQRPGKITDTVTDVVRPGDGGQTTRPDMTIRDFNPREAQRAAPGGYSGRGGSGSGPQGGAGYGPWRAEGGRMAEGGRIGYQEGELVEDEYMAEATPGGMMEENVETVQGEPTREQLEVIALEIFRLPLEELNEQQLNVVYQAAMEQEPAEEEVQFAAQEGPGEGIASLV